MSAYLLLKLVHVLSATVILGTGSGIAFFMLKAYISKDMATIKNVSQFVVLGDWIFTMPAVIIQFITGILLMMQLNYSFTSRWFMMVIGLFLFVGLCWLPVLYLQYQFRNITSRLQPEDIIPNRFHHYMRIWILLGVFGFSGVVVIYYLMVFKPGL